MQYENNTLYYIYDPMCSWCYAFEQSLHAIKLQLPTQLNFKTVLGGLAADTDAPMPEATRSMIQQAWRQIESTVPNIRFNFNFWSNNTPYRSTYPACRAILAAENQSPGLADAMRIMLQQAYYQDTKNPSLEATLLACAQQLALNIDQFTLDLCSSEINQQLNQHIQLSRMMQATSFPSIRLILKDELYTLPLNYINPGETLDQLHKLLGQHQETKVESPCTHQCSLDKQDVCLGCFRLMHEITDWAYASETGKTAILRNAQQRKNLYNKKLI
jgi:putative protein-disulfide isomerase